MKKKAMSFWLATILIAAIFTVLFAGTTTAINNDHNLSGLVWESDGSTPTTNTTFCLYVFHNGVWERFPATGWVMTERGTTDNRYWYSFVLPNEDHNVRWADGDKYKVHVDGSPWGEFNGNTTSNGTGSAGDPFPTPYDPTNPANSENDISYSAGGGPFNEQQWDVRTVAPIDLATTNVTSDGRNPSLYPGGLPAPPHVFVPITFNVTNFGSVLSGDFYVSVWNCTSTGQNLPGGIIDEIPISSLPGGGDSGERTVYWYSSLAPGDYYVNITADNREEITEYDEVNNRVILHFVVGPELIITKVLVNGDTPNDPHNVGPGSQVTISVKVKNIGPSATGGAGTSFNVTVYNITGPNGSRIPGTEIYNTQIALDSQEESADYLNFMWTAPTAILTDSWINITVDFFDDVWEANEDNNDVTVHLFVPDTPVTTIWSTTPVHVEGFPISIWYVNSSTELYFTVGGSYPPFYTWYRIIDYTTGSVKKDWSNFTLEASNFDLSAYGEGTYRIEYYSIDSIPNTEPTNNKFIIVDDTPPTTSLSVGGPRYRSLSTDLWNITSHTTLTIMAVDNPLGLSIIGELNASGIGDESQSEIYYRIVRQTDSQVMRPWTQATILIEVDGVYTTQSFTMDTTWEDGLYVIEYYSFDNLMQLETTKSTILNLDNTAPIKSIGYGDPQHLPLPGDLLYINSQTPITLGADDGTGSGVKQTDYRVWGSTFDTGWVTYSAAITISSSWDDGEYLIEYNSTDNLGNDNTTSDRFYLDNTGPDSEFVGYTNLNIRYEIDPFTTNFTFDADDHAGSGVFEIHYRRDSEPDYQVYTGPGTFIDLFNPDEEDIPWNHTIYLKSSDNLGNDGPEITLLLFIEGDITPPLPPVLKAYRDGDNIRLEWEPDTSPVSEDIHHYLIYRSTSKDGFDFTNVWINTAEHPAANPIPLRTTWNDTDATTSDEYYYSIRGVDDRNNVGYTSNIVGKVTLRFQNGYNTFSLPLRPHDDVTTTAIQILAEDDFADKSDTIYRYDNPSHQWIGRAKEMPGEMDDFTLNFGEGYMVYIAENSAEYTFTGEAGTAIRFMGDVVGDNPDFRDSLTVTPSSDGTKVTLSWSAESQALGYNIYRGTARLGPGSLNDFSISQLNGQGPVTQTTWEDSIGSTAVFYLVVALDSHGIEGSSTYGVGVRKVSFSDGYSLIGLELEPENDKGLGTLANDMFSREMDTLYYYDRASESWQGHPDILPENINNVNIDKGKAYIVYVDAEDVSYVFTGV